MRSGPGLAVAVASLVVLAGCGALVGGQSTRESTDTVTPVPVTTGDATPTTRGALPPGIMANGSIDVERLVAAHESYVADLSYTWRIRYTVTRGNDTVEENITRRVRVGNGRFLIEQTNAEQSRTRSLYVGGAAYLKSTTGVETRVQQVSRPQDHRTYAFAGDVIGRFLRNLSVDVRMVERDDQRYYRLFSDGNDGPSPLNRFGSDVWNYTITAYVTPAGFVRTVAVDYRRNGADGVRRISTRYDYSAVGSTTVAKPGWVSGARPTQSPTPSPTGVRTATHDPTPGTSAPTGNETATTGRP